MSPNEWTLASRHRYALVHTAITAGLVTGIGVVYQGIDSVTENLWIVIAVVLTSFVLNAWVWYPRAKRKITTQGR